MLVNECFDGLTQKGFLPGMSGCVEHATLCSEAMKDSKRSKRSIAIVWIDLKNAFGSVKHNLIQAALQRYHITLKIRRLVFSYYEHLTASLRKPQTRTFLYSIGVFQGCPLSQYCSISPSKSSSMPSRQNPYRHFHTISSRRISLLLTLVSQMI